MGECDCAISGMAQNFKLRHSRNGTKFPFCHEIIYIPHHIYPASAFFPFSSCAICGMARNFKLRHSRNGTKLIRGINSRNAQKNSGPQKTGAGAVPPVMAQELRVMAQELCRHLQRCLKHDDVAKQLTLRDLHLACEQWACDSLRELTEEMEMWKWDDALGNKWARVAMCSQRLNIPPFQVIQSHGTFIFLF